MSGELFGEEEKALLKWSIRVREKMVADKIEEGINTNGDMRVVAETLNGMDSSTLTLAKLDQDDKKMDSDADIQNAMLEVMKKAKMMTRVPTSQERDIIVDDNIFIGEILDSELSEPGLPLPVNDFLEEEN